MSLSSVVRAAGLAAGLAWTSIAMAQSGKPLSPRTVEGRVVSVDPQDHSLRVDESDRAPSDGASTTKLDVVPGATVVRDGLNVRFDEVKPGDEVRASFLADDLTRTHPWGLEFRSPHGPEAPWGVGTGG